jgi:hypothetical protein
MESLATPPGLDVKIWSPGFSQLVNILRPHAATITGIARMDSTDVPTQAFAQPEIAPVLQEAELPAPTSMAASTHIQSPVGQAGDQCPSCGAVLAVDQRYCLECGHRRGDPRLPFMDAVVLMDAVKRPRQAPPSPPSKKRRGISPNAALIAGVGTLLLALGIGVLIGRSGENGSSAPVNTTPQVITVEGHGGGGKTASAATSKGPSIGGGSGKSKKSAKAKAATGSSGTSKAAEEVLKPASGVKLPPPTAQLGDPCEGGTAGCEHGEQTGNFFK